MGSQIGPLLADIFMRMLEAQKLSSFINKFAFYCRYVDHIFVIAENTVELDEVLNFFNSVHIKSKFSAEQEADNHLSFQDVKVSRRGKYLENQHGLGNTYSLTVLFLLGKSGT